MRGGPRRLRAAGQEGDCGSHGEVLGPRFMARRQRQSCILSANETSEVHMPSEINSKIADNLVVTAVSSLWSLPSEKILCTRRALKEAILAAVQEAYEIGFLSGRETRFRDSTHPGGADRPLWMDIRLDDQAAMAIHHLRLRPIVVRSLLGAGYQYLGDLRWVPIQELIGLFYVGRKTARQIRATMEQLERDGGRSGN